VLASLAETGRVPLWRLVWIDVAGNPCLSCLGNVPGVLNKRGTWMAFIRRVLAGLVTIVTVVLGLSLVVAGPAAADDLPGVWKAYGNTNPITSSSSTWRCAPTVALASNVGAQVCAIRSSGGYVQAAAIVRNNRSSLFATSASTGLSNANGDYLGLTWKCSKSGVAKNSWSVCFGGTIKRWDAVSAEASASSYLDGVQRVYFLGHTSLI
jgi:hypothetical protein